MKTKPLTLLLALTFLFLFSGSVYGDDYNEAFKGWKLAAEQGDVEAQYNLGLTYANGEGVPQDLEAALKWWKLAAEQGSADAQSDLGVMDQSGIGVPQDYKEALKWNKLAGEQG